MSAISERRSAISGSMAIASHEGRLGDCGVGEDAPSGAHGTPPADAALRHLAGKAGKTSAECPSRFLGGCVRSRVAGGPGPSCVTPPDARREIATESDGLEEM